MGKKRGKPTASALLEDLPNETFVEIFSYLNGVDAVFAFSQLNYRFQCLIFKYCPFFDLKSISKVKFDLLLQQHDKPQWKSLALSNDDDAPGQLEYFLENYCLVEYLSQLRSLSMFKLNTSRSKEIFVEQLRSLTNLHSLTIETICGTTMTDLHLPKLRRLVLSSCRNTKWIADLSELESVEYTIANCCSCPADLMWPSNLKRLKISFVRDNDLRLVQQSLSYLSKLVSLEIYQKESGQLYPDGQVWESLIRSSLPLLQHFHFYFQFIYTRYVTVQLEQAVASFSTPFYVLEKGWFIRRDVSTYSRLVAIYTVPFAFDQFTIFTDLFENSTSSYLVDDHNPSSNDIYEKVKTLTFETNSPKSNTYFKKNNVVNLIINSRFESSNWMHLLTKLRHLDIKSSTIMSPENFRYLLDNAPHLHSLAAEKSVLWTLTENWNNLFILNHLSRKIRSLKLYKTDARFHHMSRHDLQQIVRIFSSKCQHLSLYVQSPNNTIGFILKSMSQLHSLHVKITGQNYPLVDMAWLEKQQTRFNDSNCIIVNDGHHHSFWLG